MYAFFAVVLHNIYTPYNKFLIFLLTFIISCVIIFYADEKVFFLCAKIGAQLIYLDIAFLKNQGGARDESKNHFGLQPVQTEKL